MKANIESVHFKADKELLLFIDDRINKLKEHNNQILSGDVVLKIGNKPDNKVAEIRLNCRGYDLYAKKNSENFEQSIDMVIEALRRQLRKRKSKITKKRKKEE